MTTYAKYHGAVFPTEGQVSDGVVYGPTGAEFEGTGSIITPAETPGVSVVRFLVVDEEAPVVGAFITVALEDANSMTNTSLIARSPIKGVTGSGGYVDLDLIQFEEFTKGGIYRVTVSDATGRRLHERRVKVPSLASLYAEDLTDA